MKFTVSDMIAFPVEKVYAVFRNHTPDLADYIPDVKRIEVVEKQDMGNRLKLVTKWIGSHQPPKIVQKLIRIEDLYWFDRAEWVDDEKAVYWRIEPVMFSKYFEATGKNQFRAKGDKTEVILEGELKINLHSHPAVPRFLASKIEPQIEKYILNLIKPNLLKTNRGAEKYLVNNK